jgi:4-hydroxy-tetrahydrodipicolinate reductase
MSRMNVTIIGSRGRMGQALILSAQAHEMHISGTIDQGDDPEPAIKASDVVIDFSYHSVTPCIAELCAKYNKPLVIGTTGHSEEERQQILTHTANLPIVWAGNYSTGVNLLYYLTKKAAQVTGLDFHPEVIEMHHQFKVDAPSGTAEGLVNAIKEARSSTEYQIKHGRSGISGARSQEEIGVHSIRGGSIVGEHTVLLVHNNERIELTHKAVDRSIFADGAMKAGIWLKNQKPGLYEMLDVLGLKDE